ncbi:MAG TPA: O-antigen ligase family protein [Gemmatimonadaceae bacterium]|nr:O-antigen ligase family protein [Gemmatimonadaceae bacterium]
MAAGARDRIALHVLQLGAVAVVLAALPYKLFDLDRYFVPKELVLHAAAGIAAIMLVANRKRLTFSAVDLLLAGFLVSSVVSAGFAINLWAAERAVAISLSGAALFWSAQALRRAGLVRPLLVALAIGVVLGAATSLAQAYGVSTEYFSINRAPGGTFGNRNFVAHLCAIGTPVVILVALTAPRGLGSLFGAVGMAVVSAALVMSRSRAAWLAVIVLAIPVGGLALMTWSRWCEARTLRRLTVLGIAAATGVAAAILLPNSLNWKSENPYLESATGLVNYKEGSGHGRIVQYTNSLHMTLAHPLLGVGPGNWPVVYPKFASRNDPSMSSEDGVTSNPWPSSDWAAYLSERGVIATAMLVLAYLALLIRALRDLRRGGGRDQERVLTAIALVGTLAATAVVGAFDAVLLIAVPTFFVWTLAGALAPPPGGGVSVDTGVREFAPVLVFALAVIAIGRSAFQLAAIATFSTSSRVAAMDRASLFDPGSYRIRLKTAQAYLARGDCTHARPNARAAHNLMPSAAEGRRAAAACGSSK